MNFVFIMDPLESVLFEKDTTLAFMFGATRKKHNVFFVPNTGISSDRNEIIFLATRVMPQHDRLRPFEIHETTRLKGSEVDAVFIRTDPPFDNNYLENTWLLDRLPSTTFVMNRPEGIRTVNEKIWATQFLDCVPQTIVSSDKHLLMSFLADVGRAVVKPTNGFGGQSVFKLTQGDSNALVAMETLTNRWQKNVIVQEYVPAAQDGDKRILLLNGEVLGAVLRVHSADDHRNNFFAGGEAVASTISEKEQKIITRLRPYLLQHGLYFVGLDFMGDYLIEVNVTSPTCLQEMNRLYNKTLEDDVIAFVEQQISATA